ncbi:LLM class flavin-dependent oxidoreductase [Bradyrhizobium elkanii]|uniref:LLM class flavin-dependent oxidoreductase n=1 Tax=Bradyrhizobium elkanii TaxID=29448 RepID=UPI0030B836B8
MSRLSRRGASWHPHGLSASPNLFFSAGAQRTRTLRLGPLVILLNLCHPLRAFEEICMLNQLSGGRASAAAPSRSNFRFFGVLAARPRIVTTRLPKSLSRPWKPMLLHTAAAISALLMRRSHSHPSKSHIRRRGMGRQHRERLDRLRNIRLTSLASERVAPFGKSQTRTARTG